MSAPGEKPVGFEGDLGPYQPVKFDDAGREGFAWGHRILRRLGPDRWAEIGKHGRLWCNSAGLYPDWFLVTRQVSPAEAAEKWGPPAIEFGPRSGFRSVSYGDVRFSCREMDPR